MIGFRYARMAPETAAADLVRRISAAGNDALVTIALDGENPWEHYPESGEGFLEALYTALSASPDATVLPRDELRARRPRARISRIHSGSWIDANFRIWIGHPEDNAAWTLLGAARGALEQTEMTVGLEQIEAARAELFVAEGSDWFWWYGDDFVTDSAATFDALFRGRVLLGKGGGDLPVIDETGARCGIARTGVLVELALSLTALGLFAGNRISLVVRVLRGDLEIERLPRLGELETVVPDRRFEQAHWQV